jgi:hypothetical protein
MAKPPRFLPTLLVTALPLLPLTTHAVAPINFEVRDNADLVELCSTPPGDPNYVAAIHYCHGVAVGFARYYDAISVGKDFEHIFCVPKAVTRNQVLTQYVAYSKAHPGYDHEALGNVLIKFLTETYPCAIGQIPDKR